MEQPEWNTVARLNVILICVRACVCVCTCVYDRQFDMVPGEM